MAWLAAFAWPCTSAVVCCFLPRFCLWWPGDDDGADDPIETVDERAPISAGPRHQAEIVSPVSFYSVKADDVRDGKLWLTKRDAYGWITSRGVLKLDPASEAQPPNVLRAVEVE